jgi:predicted outer membrane repeat protein
MSWLSFFSGLRLSRTPRSGRCDHTAARRRTRLGLETLEDRCVPTVFTVNSLADLSLAAGVDPATGAINGTNTVTLRSAIQAANMTPGGNTINLAAAGTYKIALAPTTPNEADNLAGEFAILPTGGDLTIQNSSGGKVTADAGGVSRVFDINPNFDAANPTPKFLVTLQGLTITGGRAFDATGQNVDGGVASGGGIRDQGNASLTLNNVVVTNNSASADGGGISMENTVSVPWTLTLNNSTVSFNTAGDAGGGVETDGSGKFFVNASSITENTTVNQGAGIWLDAIQVGTVFQSAILSVNQSNISSNTALAGPGGGIGDAGNDTFIDAQGNVTQGQTAITNSTLANNLAGLTGGGFGDENNQDSLAVLNTTFDHNSAIGNGGGIFFSGRTVTINDSTITGNITQGQGGGIDVTGILLSALNNTIVAQNFSDSLGAMNFLGAGADVFAHVAAGSGNFIGIGDPLFTGITDGTNGNHIGTAANPLDPLLGPLQNNGGATPTRAPLAGSPVIDAGVNGILPANTLTDQRSFLRLVNNTVDIGAVEFQPPATTTLLTASALTTRFGDPVTFTATVTAQTPGNTPTGTVTFTVDGVPQTPVPLNNGVATLTLMSLPTGTHTVTATYSGDINFTTSMASVNETVQGIRDVTGLVKVTRVVPKGKHGKKANPLQQTLMLTNMGGAPITGPVYLVLDGLTNGVMLKNASGVSQTHVTPGDPFVVVSMGDLAAGQSQMVNLVFTTTNKKAQVNFNTFVLAGPGTV